MALGAAALGAMVGLRRHTVGETLSPTSVASIYETPAGRRARITLADGSHVTLAPGSRLRLQPDFGVGTRDVWLDGEAYFMVRHDTAHPFTVHTANAVVRDLGTTFNVRAYPETPNVQVSVVDGSVALASTVQGAGHPVVDSIVLRASDIGVVGSDGRLTRERQGDVTARTAWTSGKLVFNARPVSEVLPMLSRWYDIDIRFSDPAIRTRVLTTTLDNMPAAFALERIARVLDLRVTQMGRIVTLNGDRE